MLVLAGVGFIRLAVYPIKSFLAESERAEEVIQVVVNPAGVILDAQEGF